MKTVNCPECGHVFTHKELLLGQMTHFYECKDCSTQLVTKHQNKTSRILMILLIVFYVMLVKKPSVYFLIALMMIKEIYDLYQHGLIVADVQIPTQDVYLKNVKVFMLILLVPALALFIVGPIYIQILLASMSYPYKELIIVLVTLLSFYLLQIYIFFLFKPYKLLGILRNIKHTLGYIITWLSLSLLVMCFTNFFIYDYIKPIFKFIFFGSLGVAILSFSIQFSLNRKNVIKASS